MIEAKTSGFRWLPSYYEATRDLSDNERLALYDAILDFGFGNEVAELPPMLNSLFHLIVPSLEKSIRFEEKQKLNGAKGGRPRKEVENPHETQVKPRKSQSDSGENLAVAVDNAIAIENEKAAKSLVHAYGIYGWVKLTEEQHKRLLDDLGQSELDRCITVVDESAQTTGNRNQWKDWNLVIRKCHRDGWGLHQNQKQPPQQPKPDLSWRDSRAVTPDDLVEYPVGSGQYRPRWEVPHD